MTKPDVWPGMSREYFDAVKTYLGVLADHIGLMDWKIKLCTDPSQYDDCYASCEVTYGRKLLEINLCKDFAHLDPEEVRHTLTHELTHAHLDGIDAVLTRTMPSVLGSQTWTLLRDVIHREIEVATDVVSEIVSPHLPAFQPPATDALPEPEGSSSDR